MLKTSMYISQTHKTNSASSLEDCKCWALLLLGQIPIEGQIHKRMLYTFRNVIANTNSVEQNIAYTIGHQVK
jgi:hypothetical protein